MAAKTQLSPQDTTGTFALSQNAPPISLTSSVLASTISLPDCPLIFYSVFTCLPTIPDQLEHLALARRRVWQQNKGKSFVDSLLPAVHISKDASTLYVFALGSTQLAYAAQEALSRLRFETLTLMESSSFTPTAIYPCSDPCSTRLAPCERCLDTATHPVPPVKLLPRVSLRLPLALFLQSCQERLIDDIAEASKLHTRGRSVTRLKAGFLLGPVPTTSEWGSGWESYARCRPLISCTLQLHISQPANPFLPTRLIIHPVLHPTYYLPLRSSLPLPAGTPIVLLPDGVPAYYLSAYSGPITALTSQFEDALFGLGAGNWKHGVHTHGQDFSQPGGPNYIVAWLAVQNKQGEDKGMPVIWPATLCVSYHASSTSSHARSSLPYIPELPAQLQSSPVPPASAIPASLSFTMTTSTSSSSSVEASSSSTTSGPLPIVEHFPAFQQRPSLLRSSPTSDSLHALRSLTLSKKPYIRDIKRVAADAGTYVDTIVKERERERERIRKERQDQEIANARAKLASATPQTAPEPPPPVSDPPALSAPESVEDAPHDRPPPEVEVTAPELSGSESDHSGDSLFSPPDATIDLPFTEDDQPSVVPEQPPNHALAVPSADYNVIVAEAEVRSSSTGLDPFHGFDASWVQHPNTYMDMNMDYDMDFNMNIDPLPGPRNGGAGGGTFDVEAEDGFDVFTEDDFNFFDGPSTQRGPVSAILPPVSNAALTPAAGPPSYGLTPLLPPVETSISGPGPPSASANHPSPWATQVNEVFTPRMSIDVHGFLDSVAPPDLIPSSPTRTLSSYSAPATPSIHLADSFKPADGRRSSMSTGPNIFDPIPFASSHREADGKYAVGKFALPPPDELSGDLLAAKANTPAGWKARYHAVTDPRIGVIRLLRGVKRKSIGQGVREPRRTPLWESYREPELWQSSSPPHTGPDSEESDEEFWMEDEEATAAVPRPSTPPPSYLPLGPTLLHTHFHHFHLLPMCTPLRPPGMTVNSTPGNTAPISVPTPVSPAAVLGATSEKLKSLEATAHILLKEVVENPVWFESWRANASLSSDPPVLPAQIWQADTRYINQLLGSQGFSTPVEVQALFGASDSPPQQSEVTLQTLVPPLLAMAKGENIIQLSPTSLRFWEKLGLSPRSGSKDVTAFVFYEGGDEDREAEIESWLERVSAAYSSKNFGAHVAGMTSENTKRGLVPTRFDTLRKTLISFVSTVPERHPNLVFYIATPSHIISSSSTTLRQILSAVKRFYKAYQEGDILIHFVPDSLISGTHVHPASSLSGLDVFACSVYDRILQPVNRAMSRKFFTHGPPVVAYLEAPAYALVSVPTGKSRQVAAHPRVSFSLESTASSLDVMHRHMLLHVGYQISSCGRWTLASCVDAEGEAHDLKAWLIPDENVEEFVVNQVWTFVHAFSRRANIEWRIVISKLGLMSHAEIEAWTSHLESVVTASSDVPPVYVTVLSVDTDNSWTFLSADVASFDILKRPMGTASPIPSIKSSSRHSHTTFSDACCATYSLSPPPDLTMYPAYIADRTIKYPSVTIPGSSEPPFIPDVDDDDGASIPVQLPSVEPIRVPAWSTLVCVPSSTDPTTVSTIRIFKLHVAHSLRSTYGISGTGSDNNGVAQPEGAGSGPSSHHIQTELMADIVRNFHELAVLSRARWRLRANPGLPFHLATLEVMCMALRGGAVDP